MPNSPLARTARGWWIGVTTLAFTSVAPLSVAHAAPQEPPASPEPTEERSVEAARVLAYEAQAAYDVGDYERAARTADAAQRLVQAPTLALLEARALVHLNRWLEARSRFRTAAEHPGPSASEAFVRASRSAAEELEQLERNLPQLLVRLTPPRAAAEEPPRAAADEPRIRVDGVLFPTGSLGVWMPFDPGPHVVELQTAGTTERHEVHLRPGAREELQLGVVVAEAFEAEDRPSSPVPWVATAGGLALAGLGVGIGFGVHAGDLRTQLDATCPAAECPASEAGTLSDYRTARDLSTAGYIVAGVAAAAGAVVLIAWPSGNKERPQTALALGPGQLTLRGAF